MQPLAHSARPKRGIKEQTYTEHVARVESGVADRLRDLTPFGPPNCGVLFDEVSCAARFHDVGKLIAENQRVLQSSSHEPLPIPHEYAGVHYLYRSYRHVAAVLVYYHHAGLQNLQREIASYSDAFRSVRHDTCGGEKIKSAIEAVDSCLKRHFELLPTHSDTPGPKVPHFRVLSGVSGISWRIALSVLADADHFDTARHYGQEPEVSPAEPRWGERIAALERYIRDLPRATSGSSAKRNEMRQKIYEACRDSKEDAAILACDSPVGTGKTTAVMARLLQVAEAQGLRHIFVVLPYTNIVNQAVKTYRDALRLPGEDPERVVAAHHHLAEYSDPESRHLTTLWDCPIIVTTAVQFFETLAAAKTGRLRKLHQLPGSAVFIDEAHAALPSWLWPQTWLWLKDLAQNWCCSFVLASGSLARFWEHDEFVNPPEFVNNLVRDDLRGSSQDTETDRIRLKLRSEPLTLAKLTRWLHDEVPGPRFCILNTLQSAAVVARALRMAGGDVLHLSTALAPAHREAIVDEIKRRLEEEPDRDWTLVATSCVEAGLDFSFRSGVREAASVSSLIQASGRVNRHGKWTAEASIVWTITLVGPEFRPNRMLKASAEVLLELFRDGSISNRVSSPSELCTRALTLEMQKADIGDLAKIIDFEKGRRYDEVAEAYKVIDEDSVLAVVNPLSDQILEGRRLSRHEMQKYSVAVPRYYLQRYALCPFEHYPGVYRWMLDYDSDFLGYMAGALTVAEAERGDAQLS